MGLRGSSPATARYPYFWLTQPRCTAQEIRCDASRCRRRWRSGWSSVCLSWLTSRPPRSSTVLLELDMAAVTWMAASSLHAPCGSCRYDAAHKRAVATAGPRGRGVEVCVGGNASPPLANSPATLLPALNLSKRVCARARVQFVQTFPATSMVPSTPVPSHPDAASTASFR